MAILSVTETWRGQTWSDSKDGSREYERVFLVQSDDPLESPQAVRLAAGLPLPWESYPDDLAAVCVGRSARREDATRLLWTVTVNYAWSPEDENDTEDPLLREPEIDWTSNFITKPVIRDRNGNACVNSAGDYYDPPLEADVVRWIANITFNASDVPAGVKLYAGAINQSPIVIDGDAIAAERARIVGMRIGKRTTENDVSFKPVTLSIECREADDDPFDVEALDQGFRIKDGTDLKDILIEDEDGNKNRPSAPVLLDGMGGKLSDPSPTTAIFNTYEFPRRVDMTVFPGIT